jgi:hypothetical protein
MFSLCYLLLSLATDFEDLHGFSAFCFFILLSAFCYLLSAFCFFPFALATDFEDLHGFFAF